MRLSRIKKTIEKVRELPTLPVIANKINALLADPRSNSSDLSAVIERDQSIATKILTLVNSAFYSLPQRVSNITQAISLLGYKNISYCVMALSVFDTLKFADKGSFDRREFWIHSIATALLSVKISERCMYDRTEDIFTAGLLHDLGKVFMDGFLHEEFSTVLETANEKKVSFYSAEHELYDIDHAMIGEWIARTWKLPLHVIATIKHHHQELNQRKGFILSSDLSVDIVQIADTGVRIKGFGKNGDGGKFSPDFNAEQFRRLPISETDVFELLKGLEEDVKNSETLLNFAL